MPGEIARFTGRWDYSELPRNVEVAEGCYLERSDSFARFFSERTPGLRLGRNVRVYTWTQFSVEKNGLIEVGSDSVLIGAHFMCADHIKIGERVLIGYNVLIGDCDFHPLDAQLRIQDAIASAPGADPSRRPPLVSRPVTIEDETSIGMNATILKGVTLGRAARVMPGAVVVSDVEAGMTVAGNPAKPVEGS